MLLFSFRDPFAPYALGFANKCRFFFFYFDEIGIVFVEFSSEWCLSLLVLSTTDFRVVSVRLPWPCSDGIFNEFQILCIRVVSKCNAVSCGRPVGNAAGITLAIWIPALNLISLVSSLWSCIHLVGSCVSSVG